MEGLSRVEVMRLTPIERTEYKWKDERVRKHRENNKENALEYNREYKKNFIERDENKEQYKRLNRQNVNKHNNNKANTQPKQTKKPLLPRT